MYAGEVRKIKLTYSQEKTELYWVAANRGIRCKEEYIYQIKYGSGYWCFRTHCLYSIFQGHIPVEHLS